MNGTPVSRILRRVATPRLPTKWGEFHAIGFQEETYNGIRRIESALGGTDFTISNDAKGPGMTTSISASDRAQTIRAAIDSLNGPEQFARPGHVFPLRSRNGGVLERRGHTEAAVALAQLAGLRLCGVICEILNEDGTMARVPDLIRLCQRYGFKLITVAELVRYRLERESERRCGAREGRVPVVAL